MEPDYDQSIDIWSLGCIIAEIIHCSQPYVKPLLQLRDRQARKLALKSHLSSSILFPGQTCYPLSPAPVNESTIASELMEQDQLQIINNTLGELSTDDTSFISESKSVKRQMLA